MEIVTFPLREKNNLIGTDGDMLQALKDSLNILTEQAGFHRAFWGRETETPNTIRFFVDWASVEAHYDFMKKEYGHST